MSKLATVLIVDDNPRCLEFMTLAFAAQGGITVSSEIKPVTALDRIRSEKPDLVVLDVKMPELDGFGVLSLLRGEGNPVPVVMCSGSALQNDIDRAYAGGCSGYLEKPTTMEDYRTMAGAILQYWKRGELPRH
ncbi:MAG TPA: response regulator [Hyphomonadaceae bacterium]|jgi:CheY-like chemotaxis protein|nr:response regulator [Hyphomonadaceae bacterium]HPI48167.1 response regulator [Hyphomonadaceae bacterium]